MNGDGTTHDLVPMSSQAREALMRTAPLFSAAVGFQFGLIHQQKDPSILPFTAVKLEEKGIRAGADSGTPVCGLHIPLSFQPFVCFTRALGHRR